MRRSLSWVFVLSVVLPGCSASSDLRQLCELSQEVLADANVAKPHKVATIHERFDKPTRSSAARKCVMASLGSNLPPAQKYDALEQCAREVGSSDWTCAPLREFLKNP